MDVVSSDLVQNFRLDLLAWGEKGIRDFAWRNSDMTLYEVFIAEFLLSKTQAEQVDKIYLDFLEQYPGLASIFEASQEEIEEIIEPLGLQKKRSQALKKAANEFDQIPGEREVLLEMPQVGPYVANATLCFYRGDPLPLLDTNVERVMSRLLGKDWPNDFNEKLDVVECFVPNDEPERFNMALLDFGAKICRPTPLCGECFATDYCHYYNTNVSG